MRGRTLATFFATTAMIAALAAPRTATAGKMVVLSLGDSIGFGETTFTNNPSNGDRGYVSLYADSLTAANGGIRPNVVNLAVDGETTTSFRTGTGRVAPAAGFTDTSLARLNSNYTSDPTITQDTQLATTIAQQKAAGNTIGAVTISLGSNDLFALAQTPGFMALSANQQGAKLLQTFAAVQANYTSLLTEVHASLPNATVSLVGTYNPFVAAPGSPFAPIAGVAIAGMNQLIANVAANNGVHYIDTTSVFAGHESAFTHILDAPAGTYNVHPNGLGYAALGLQVSGVNAVPEPTTLAILGTMGLGLLVSRQYRRTRVIA